MNETIQTTAKCLCQSFHFNLIMYLKVELFDKEREQIIFRKDIHVKNTEVEILG